LALRPNISSISAVICVVRQESPQILMSPISDIFIGKLGFPLHENGDLGVYKG